MDGGECASSDIYDNAISYVANRDTNWRNSNIDTGFLESLDDFYLMDSRLVMLQTTNSLYNTSLYQYVTPESVLAWQRVRVANMMASGGREWYNVVKMYNSGIAERLYR